MRAEVLAFSNEELALIRRAHTRTIYPSLSLSLCSPPCRLPKGATIAPLWRLDNVFFPFFANFIEYGLAKIIQNVDLARFVSTRRLFSRSFVFSLSSRRGQYVRSDSSLVPRTASGRMSATHLPSYLDRNQYEGNKRDFPIWPPNRCCPMHQTVVCDVPMERCCNVLYGRREITFLSLNFINFSI